MSKNTSHKKKILIILPSNERIGGVEIPLYEFIERTDYTIVLLYLKTLKCLLVSSKGCKKIQLQQLIKSRYCFIFAFFWQPALFLLLIRLKFRKLVYFENTTIQYTSYRKYLQTYLRRRSNYVIFDSKDTENKNAEYIKRAEMFVLPFVPEDLARNFTNTWPKKESKANKACIVTRWSAEKGVNYLWQLSDSVLANLKIVTPSSIPRELKKKCAGVIDGNKRELIWSTFQNSNYCLSLSTKEGLGISILEAISANCIPLILSDHFIKKIIEENEPQLKINNIKDIQNILTRPPLNDVQKVKLLEVLRREISKNSYDVPFSDSMQIWLREQT
jgi:hypothetical protein